MEIRKVLAFVILIGLFGTLFISMLLTMGKEDIKMFTICSLILLSFWLLTEEN